VNTTSEIHAAPVELQRPVVIVAAPRSGSTFLFETLTLAEGLVTIGGESHAIFEDIPKLRPGVGGLNSNRLTEVHLTPRISARLYRAFHQNLRDRNGQFPGSGARFLEKTPKNALRIPFLRALFPDAQFIYLYRAPMPNISSIMEAWRSGRFVTYRNLPEWTGNWSLALVPGWEQMRGRSLAEIASFQWQGINRQIMEDLAQMDADRWIAVDYDQLTQDTPAQIRRLCSFVGIEFDSVMARRLSQGALPSSRYTVTAPMREKWRSNEQALLTVAESAENTWREIVSYTRDQAD
jgi:hypothetical protein